MFVPRRLDKYLRDSTTLSVSEIRAACRAGRVTVHTPGALGPTPAVLDALIFEGDTVALDGRGLSPRSQHAYFVLNKPRHVTATARDPGGRADLSIWLRQLPAGVFPVGRLDRESSGALLFTDDGDLANAILQPSHHTKKLYWLWVDEHLVRDDPRLLAFVRGVRLDAHSGVLRAVSAQVLFSNADYTELHVMLDEGKNRHIRKMCNGLGLPLLQLHRKTIGSLSIEGLAAGDWRKLDASEVAALWSSCGGAARVTQTKVAALAQTAKAAREARTPIARLEQWLGRVCPVAPV